jgi:predicted RNA binding protein YcfA (HicA-like mRNA interferase family)
MNPRRVLRKIIASPANVRFGELVGLVQAFGFRLARVSGGHHIFLHPQVPQAVTIQNVDGKAKPYQVRQVLKLVEQYNLQLPD